MLWNREEDLIGLRTGTKIPVHTENRVKKTGIPVRFAYRGTYRHDVIIFDFFYFLSVSSILLAKHALFSYSCCVFNKTKLFLSNVCLSNVLIQLLCFVLLCLPIIALYDINWNWCFIFLSFCSPSFWKWLHTCTKRCTSNKTPKIWDTSQTMQKSCQVNALFRLSPTLTVLNMYIFPCFMVL